MNKKIKKMFVRKFVVIENVTSGAVITRTYNVTRRELKKLINEFKKIAVDYEIFKDNMVVWR